MLRCVYHPSLVAQTSTEGGQRYQDHVRLPGIFCDEPGHGQDRFIPSLITIFTPFLSYMPSHLVLINTKTTLLNICQLRFCEQIVKNSLPNKNVVASLRPSSGKQL